MPSPLDESQRDLEMAKTAAWICAPAVLLGLFVVPGWFGDLLFDAGIGIGFIAALRICSKKPA